MQCFACKKSSEMCLLENKCTLKLPNSSDLFIRDIKILSDPIEYSHINC